MKDKRKLSFFSIVLIFSQALISAQSYNIDYYGIISTQIDTNMSKMTSDLYYTQLSEINNFSVSDKRNGSSVSETEPDFEDFSDTKLSFYTLITKNEKTDKWITVFKVIDKINNEEHSKKKEYDSFYKILMEPKSVLKETIKNLIENDAESSDIHTISAKNINEPQIQPSPSSSSESIQSTEILSGTWAGEDSIDKVVILRGGRGFVIFKNGASMNIGIELSIIDNKQTITITQKGRSNASFYPELPRSIALTAAPSAQPITWTLTPVNEDTLKGTKNTLIQNSSGYENGSISVEWRRVN